MDLYDFINHATLGSPLATEEGATGSSIWGWTDPRSGREFIGRLMSPWLDGMMVIKSGMHTDLSSCGDVSRNRPC